MRIITKLLVSDYVQAPQKKVLHRNPQPCNKKCFNITTLIRIQTRKVQRTFPCPLSLPPFLSLPVYNHNLSPLEAGHFGYVRNLLLLAVAICCYINSFSPFLSFTLCLYRSVWFELYLSIKKEWNRSTSKRLQLKFFCFVIKERISLLSIH